MSDNSSYFGGCSKAKKSKTEDQIQSAHWAFLPSVVIHEIFDCLNETDRQNASSVCKNWRQSLFHPRWWTRVTFKIEPNNSVRSKFFTTFFGKTVTKARIQVSTLGPECTDEFITLLEALSENNNLNELIIEPSHCHFDMLTYNTSKHDTLNEKTEGLHCKYDTNYVIMLLKRILPGLKRFSIGGIENFSHYLDEYLKILSSHQPSKLTLLGLASVKDNPNEYLDSAFEYLSLKNFTNMKILSIDFDQLSDHFLQSLGNSKKLERLIIHLHGLREGHPGTTNSGWVEFKKNHPKCELRLSVIHSYDEIVMLHETVLKEQMPLTHLKVFFCENVNMSLLELLPVFYQHTLRSIIWVDSLSISKKSWSFLTPNYDYSPDPLIMISWLCKNLEELVFYGYKYCEENLIAIARLRGEKLKHLELAEDDIWSGNNENPRLQDNYLVDIPLHMKKSWAPVKFDDLHPVLRDPAGGDSDEYLLPIVLSDLH